MTESDEVSSDVSETSDSGERDILEIREPRDLLLVGILLPFLLLAFLISIMILSPLLEVVVIGISYVSQDLADSIKNMDIPSVGVSFETVFYITHLVPILSIIADSILVGDSRLRLIAGVAVIPLGSAVLLLSGIGDVGSLAGIYYGMAGIGVAFVGWGTIIWYVAARKNALNRKKEPQQPGS